MSIDINVFYGLSGLKALLPNKKLSVSFYRWLLIFIALPVFFALSDAGTSFEKFLILLCSVILYNYIVSLIVMGKSGKRRKFPPVFIYTDAIAVSLLAYVLGGIDSDVYILFFFMIGYYGIANSLVHMEGVSIFIVLAYSISNVCFNIAHGLGSYTYICLLMRDALILLGAYGISFIVTEFRKYNELHRKEFQLARTDKLTGLSNRRLLEQRLDNEATRADARGKTLNILIFDIDNFKSFNDTYGHIYGDKLLETFAGILLQSIRPSDLPVRYGGEEFLILIRDLDIMTTRKIGERIRMQLEKQNIAVPNGMPLTKTTVSCGIAQYPTHSKNVRKVMELADKALYQAKTAGKNKIVCYGQPVNSKRD